jgi:sigma-B regulation protein RsbU (phosphoserine phosphatase)
MAYEISISGIDEIYFSLINKIDVSVYALDEEERLFFISPAIERISGHKCGDLTGKFLRDFLTSDAGRPPEGFFQDPAGVAVTHDVSIIDVDSTPIKCVITNYRVDGDARIKSVGLIEKNQGTDPEADEKIRKFSIAVEQSPATVVITDKHGSIEYVNPKFTRLTGYSFEEALGQNPRILKSGKQPPEFYREMWQTISSGNEWRGEFHNKKKNDGMYWEAASISPIADKYGEITHYVAVKEDITDRKMAEEALRISEENLRKRNNDMERELEYAKVVISRLLPDKPPLIKNLKVDFRYVPLDAIGGDFFSFHTVPGKGFGVFIGDVVGHGVSAALFLSLIKSVTDRLNIVHGVNPGLYIKELNQELFQSKVMMFFTSLCGYFDLSGHNVSFRFAKGGHPPPILFSALDGSTRQLDSQGIPIGLSPAAEFEEVGAKLLPGDRIYLYTDGIIEVRNADKIMIEPEGLESIIAGTGAMSLGESLDRIIDEAANFRGGIPREDDLIIIGCESL